MGGRTWKYWASSGPVFYIDPCSATSVESSRQDLLNDMAEHRPILKFNQITYTGLLPTQNRRGTPENNRFYCDWGSMPCASTAPLSLDDERWNSRGRKCDL